MSPHSSVSSVRVHTSRASLAFCAAATALAASTSSPPPASAGLTSAVHYSTGANPQAVVAIDLNHDGRLDLATVNSDDGTISVLLGNGAGGFGTALAFSAGWYPYSLAFGDFNDDGNVDLATANLGGYTALILPGNGDGTFQSPVSLWLSHVPVALATGDFDGDGNIDLVTIEQEFDDPMFCSIEILLGDGQGNFRITGTYQIRDVDDLPVVADLNADGKLDVLTSDGQILPGNGDGTLSYTYPGTFFTGTGPSQAVAVGDFTNDGVPDVIVAPGTLDVVPGLGNFTFGSPIRHTTNGFLTAVATADFNADGKLDAVTTQVDAGSVSPWLGNGDGSLTLAAALATGARPASVAVGDFNGDGRTDVAAANGDSNTVSVLLNDGVWPTLPNLPSLRISDVTVAEGNAGSVSAVFNVTLSAASDKNVTFRYATADGTAVAGSDYEARSGLATISAGQTSTSIGIPVCGDRIPDPSESFVVQLTDATNALLAGSQGVATILDEEPWISVGDVAVTEGNSRTKYATFTVRLSGAYDQPVTVSFETQAGTATPGSDYQSRSGTLSFAPGEVSKPVPVTIYGDTQIETNESFLVVLSSPSANALIADGFGNGLILNDDAPRPRKGRKNN